MPIELEKTSVKVAVVGLRDTYNDDAGCCVWEAMLWLSEDGSLANSEFNMCNRLPMSEVDDQKLLSSERSSARVQMALDDSQGTAHHSTCATGESDHFDNAAGCCVWANAKQHQRYLVVKAQDCGEFGY